MSDINHILSSIDSDAPLAQRHLWLIELLDWIRGDATSTRKSLLRLQQLIDIAQADPAINAKLIHWIQQLLHIIDTSSLLANYGFAQKGSFLAELVERLRLKIFPETPNTTNADVLYSLFFPTSFDSEWIAALDVKTLLKIASLLDAPNTSLQSRAETIYWQNTLLEAVSFCVSHLRSNGFSPEMRRRMSPESIQQRAFHEINTDFERMQIAFHDYIFSGKNIHDFYKNQQDKNEKAIALKNAVDKFNISLDACHDAATSVYKHLNEHGISIGLVFQLRQLYARVKRIRLLMDCLLSQNAYKNTAQLLASLVTIGVENRSVKGLITSNSALVAAKMADRHAEMGENYITRNRTEYKGMVIKAVGGGALVAVAVVVKYLLVDLNLADFWSGLIIGMNYAICFLVIQLLHRTLATTQPAMTAPAMAAKLKNLNGPQGLKLFVDEVAHVVRSQVAAVIGNVSTVVPCIFLLFYILQEGLGLQIVDQKKAVDTLSHLSILGPTALLAAFTGVILFISSMIAGWVENWFVLHRLESALRYSPKVTAKLGKERASYWAHFLRKNISGFTACISLGLMFGLVPVFSKFFGLNLELRHVTFAAGQIAAACSSYGLRIFQHPELLTPLLLAIASIFIIGPLNVGVSYYCAFRLALKAHKVSNVDRENIRDAILQRLKTSPMSFLWPSK